MVPDTRSSLLSLVQKRKWQQDNITLLQDKTRGEYPNDVNPYYYSHATQYTHDDTNRKDRLLVITLVRVHNRVSNAPRE
jgi:hypothetical protein